MKRAAFLSLVVGCLVVLGKPDALHSQQHRATPSVASTDRARQFAAEEHGGASDDIVVQDFAAASPMWP